MARKKSPKFLNVFKIFFSSIKTYFLYLDQTVKFLFFPVFGQILGIFLIFGCTYYFNHNIDAIRKISPFFNDDSKLLTILLIVLIPFLLIFLKAVFDYVIAFCALNLMFYTVSNKKKVKDFDINTSKTAIKRNLFKYIILMLIVSIILITPPLVFISPIIWIFLCLVFQVFSFENDNSVIKSISRSIDLVKGNIIPTITLLLLCYLSTYVFIPQLFIWAFEKISVVSLLAHIFEPIVTLLPLDICNDILSAANQHIESLTISRQIAECVISFIFICFTLPFRCCCFTELYKLYDSDKIKDYSGETEEIIKRATGKKGKI